MSPESGSRRQFTLSAAAACAAFGLDRPVALIGSASAQPAPVRPYIMQHVGDIEVISLNDGSATFPLRAGLVRNASLDEIRGALRTTSLPEEQVTIPFTVTALRMRDRIALIDAGTGGFLAYGPNAGTLPQSMAAAGIDPAAVGTILLSHLHGDHIYGLMERETLAPMFPNAEIILPAAELRWWTQPGTESLDLGPSRAGLVQRIRETLARWPNVRPVEGETEVLPGVRLLSAPGHSPAHCIHHVSAGREQLFITADVSLMPALFARNPTWQAALDQDGAMAAETRRRVFERIVADNALVTGSHWPLPNLGRIVRDGHGYAFTPIAA